jgi:uncharacterized protein
MDASVSEHLREITTACQRFRVNRLELFGSATGRHFDRDRSDVDFLVEFATLEDGEHADAYFGLRETLQSILSRPVDLVMVRAVRNPYFLAAIEPTRTLLYAA